MNMDVINNTSVKEVVLIRHGKPLSAHNDKVNSAQYAQWVRNYDKSILDPTSHPKQKTHIDDSYIVVSPLLRAKLSAAYYGATQIDEELPHLKEMDIPYYKLPSTRSGVATSDVHIFSHPKITHKKWLAIKAKRR